jgi:predicted ATPase
MKHAENFDKALNSFFQDSSGKLFANTNIRISIEPQEIQRAFEKIGASGELVMWSNTRLPVEYDKKNETFTINLPKSSEEESRSETQLFSTESIDDYDIRWMVGYNLAINIFGRAFALPAERNALVLTYKLLASRRLKLYKEMNRQRTYGGNDDESQRIYDLLREQGEIGYPQPVEDFLEFLADVEIQVLPPATSRQPFTELADIIEKEIQGRNKTSFRGTKYKGKELKISVKRGLDIDLHNASSSVKQLAPLVLYLRYRAKPNDLLVIDEPEMNLHPGSQVKLLEILAMLVNAGVRVLLTTHSPYFMSHLNNLISGSIEEPELLQKEAACLYLKRHQAFLNPEQVSAYEMRSKTLQDIKDPDFGIKWETLSDVASDIHQKYFEIYEKGKGLNND